MTSKPSSTSSAAILISAVAPIRFESMRERSFEHRTESGAFPLQTRRFGDTDPLTDRPGRRHLRDPLSEYLRGRDHDAATAAASPYNPRDSISSATGSGTRYLIGWPRATRRRMYVDDSPIGIISKNTSRWLLRSCAASTK